MPRRQSRLRLLRDVSGALQLLPPPGRYQFLLLVAANMLITGLDLIGVALVGLLGVLLVAAVQGPEAQRQLESAPWASFFPDSWTAGTTSILAVGLVAAGFLITKSLVGSLLSRRTLRFLAHRQSEVSQRLSLWLFRQPLLFIESRTSQLTAYALTGGVTAATLGLLGAGAQALAEFSLLFLLTGALLVANPIVTVLAMIFFAGLAVFMHIVLGRWAGRNGIRASRATFMLTQSIQETASSYRELLASGRLSAYVRGWSPLYWSYADSVSTSMFITQVPKYVYETALLLGALALAAWEFSSQPAAQAVATVSIFLAAGSRIMPSMLRLQNALVSIRASAGQADPTFELHDELIRAGFAGPETESMERAEGPFIADVRMTNVVARYGDELAPALIDVSLELRPGTRAAIVGPTGAGKSTLVDVMLGVLPPVSGSVSISGTVPRSAIRAHPNSVAYVPQSVNLVAGTVRQNVALGIAPEDVDDTRVWECLRTVRLDALFRNERDGLETLVGERGVTLSGGQRQRIGLARALLTSPRLLVLDEATSALDADTESAITDALRALPRDTTTVIVAHRLATVRDCDVVLYLDEGRLKGQGSFEEVRNQVPDFDRSARLLGL